MSDKPTIDISEDLIARTLQANGIYTRSQIRLYDKFTRYGLIDPFNNVTTTREYVFFTKPDCHIFSSGTTSILNPEIANLPIFYNALYNYNDILQQLQYSCNRSKPFINILSNKRTSNLDLPGITVDDIETSANLYGTKIFYRKASDQSDETHEFSLEFEDTKRLEVYMFFKLFDEYQRKKYYGKITPPSDDYIFNKILHDQISVFKFTVDDTDTIIHYAKLYGCYPKAVPREALSELPQGGPLKFSVQWKCSFVEDMEPNILVDFNKITNGLGGSTSYSYDYDIGSSPGTWVSAPYITTETSSLYGVKLNKLRWRE